MREQGSNTHEQPVTPEVADRSVGQQGTSSHDHPVDSEGAGRSLDQRGPKVHDESVTSKSIQRTVGQHDTNAGEDPVRTKIDKPSLRDRLFDGAIMCTQFTSVIAGASDLLGPLKAASDILGFVLQTVKVRIDLFTTEDKC